MSAKNGNTVVPIRAMFLLVLGCIGGPGALITATYLRDRSLQAVSDHWIPVLLCWGVAIILPPFFLASWNGRGVSIQKAAWALISAGVVHPVFLAVFLWPVAFIAHGALFTATVTLMIYHHSERKVTDFIFGEAIGWSGYFCLTPILLDFGPRSLGSAYLSNAWVYLILFTTVGLSMLIAALGVFLMSPSRRRSIGRHPNATTHPDPSRRSHAAE